MNIIEICRENCERCGHKCWKCIKKEKNICLKLSMADINCTKKGKTICGKLLKV